MRQKFENGTGIRHDLLDWIIQYAEKYQIGKVVLFGSRARGDYKKTSDIDLAVEGGNTAAFSLEIAEEAPTLLMFDIVDLDLPVQKELLESIEKEGVMLYEKV